MAIRCIQLELREVRIPFRFSFEHAKARRTEARNLILAVTTNTGHTGYGEVLTRPYLTGETLEGAWRDILELWWPRVRDLRLPEDQTPCEVLRPIYFCADEARKTASYAGIDVAVVDAWARSSRKPGRSLFGQGDRPLRLSGPIGCTSLLQTKWAARLLKLIGFREFKLKVAGGEGVQRVRAVRRLVGPHCDLRLDANGCWSVEEAITTAKDLRAFNVSSLEQPIPPGDAFALATVRREGGLPVVADESLCTLSDARDLLAARAADLWNIRPAKVGGFTGALEMIKMARKHKIGVHLGVLVGETSVLAAAGRACAWLADRHVEFGFPRVLLRLDPFTGGPDGYFASGRPLGKRPGLGVEPVRGRLERVTVRREKVN